MNKLGKALDIPEVKVFVIYVSGIFRRLRVA